MKEANHKKTFIVGFNLGEMSRIHYEKQPGKSTDLENRSMVA